MDFVAQVAVWRPHCRLPDENRGAPDPVRFETRREFAAVMGHAAPAYGTARPRTEEMLSDGRITCDTQRKDADKLIEQVRAGGLYRFERLAEAVSILVDFRKEYPDPKEIVHV